MAIYSIPVPTARLFLFFESSCINFFICVYFKKTLACRCPNKLLGFEITLFLWKNFVNSKKNRVESFSNSMLLMEVSKCLKTVKFLKLSINELPEGNYSPTPTHSPPASEIRNVFSDTNQKHFFCCVAGVYFLLMLSDLRFVKLVRFFERSFIVKLVIFFASFS